MENPVLDWTCWPTTGLIAHRCGGALAPENSLAGLDVAAGLGVRAVEFDVMLSRDGVPVLIHDDLLDRTTSGHGPVASQTAAQLATLSCARGWDERYSGEKIPTLSEALSRCRALGLVPNIEIKPSPGAEQATGEATARVAEVGWRGAAVHAGLPLLSSFSEAALMAAHGAPSSWPRALLVETVPDDWLERVRRCKAVALHCSRDQTNWGFLATAKAERIAVRCYTVDDPAEARTLWSMGVAGVFSDRIDRMSLVLADYLEKP